MITYLNLDTGEITQSHAKAVKEFFRSGANVALLHNGEEVCTWMH